MKVIDSFVREYAFLSNFLEYSTIEWQGLQSRCVESLFQAAKTFDADLRKNIAAMSPRDAKREGKVIDLREDWEDVKEDIMYELLTLKFQNPFLKSCLLATGDAELIEGNYWNDIYWGVCNGVGENRLGILLMKLRSELNS